MLSWTWARDAEYIELYNELETTLHLQPNLFIEQNKYFSTVRFPVETFHQLAAGHMKLPEIISEIQFIDIYNSVCKYVTLKYIKI